MTEPTKTRIVVADDDLDILDLVVFILTEAGFDTLAFTDGLAALAAIEADPPRLAILDIKMPGLSGVEVLRRVRASPSLSDLDVILLTAQAEQVAVDAGFAAGASDYLIKPFSAQNLVESVNALAEQDQSLRQVRTRELRTHQVILQIGQAIRAASEIQQALDVMCGALGDAIGVDRVLAYTMDVHHQVQLGAQWHRPGLLRQRELMGPVDMGGRLEGLWLDTGFWAEDDVAKAEPPPPEVVRSFLGETGARAAMTVPIGLDDKVVGVIHVLMVDEPRTWTLSESDVLKAVAGFVARAIVGVEQQANQRDYVDRVERLDRQKSDFLATVSHELRTPLTSISGYLELIRGRDVGDLTAKQELMLDAISRNTVRLRSLIEDIMVLSRIEGGASEANYGDVSIPLLITRASQELGQLAQASSIKLEIDPGPECSVALGDSTSLGRAVVNILSNAIKFSHPGGVVTLTGTLDASTRRVLITCQDHGIGIPACDVADLFTRFFRATNAVHRAIPGTGLGLSIAQQIVQDHHGQLRVTSVEEEGTTVVIDLPT